MDGSQKNIDIIIANISRIDLDFLDRICGVYFLMHGNEIKYIGQTIDIFSRIRSHHKEKRGKFDGVMFLEVADASNLDFIEKTLIGFYKPQLNGNSLKKRDITTEDVVNCIKLARKDSFKSAAIKMCIDCKELNIVEKKQRIDFDLKQHILKIDDSIKARQDELISLNRRAASMESKIKNLSYNIELMGTEERSLNSRLERLRSDNFEISQTKRIKNIEDTIRDRKSESLILKKQNKKLIHEIALKYEEKESLTKIVSSLKWDVMALKHRMKSFEPRKYQIDKNGKHIHKNVMKEIDNIVA